MIEEASDRLVVNKTRVVKTFSTVLHYPECLSSKHAVNLLVT